MLNHDLLNQKCIYSVVPFLFLFVNLNKKWFDSKRWISLVVCSFPMWQLNWDSPRISALCVCALRSGFSPSGDCVLTGEQRSLVSVQILPGKEDVRPVPREGKIWSQTHEEGSALSLCELFLVGHGDMRWTSKMRDQIWQHWWRRTTADSFSKWQRSLSVAVNYTVVNTFRLLLC